MMRLKPSRTNLNQAVCVCVGGGVYVGVCVCVCVRERERESLFTVMGGVCADWSVWGG